ncbi:hypothetical protein NQ317_015445 [Molorchus minor]|uniref:Uncharacterized protein n=1 Tax=Molorchus minor TaxID=1323400 RepID=A0ABQ9JTT6_9CUCU|nr:hypothetical protein NQ317_015445 [Molorchus minor]
MRHSSTIGLGKVLWAGLLASCLQASLIVIADESGGAKSEDENLQNFQQTLTAVCQRETGINIYKCGVKRGWNNLHGGWGLKRSVPSTDQLSYSTPMVEKRAWQNFQGGWGKRYLPTEDDLAIQELASILEQENNPNIPPLESNNDFEINDDEKRNWNKFSDGWGKRSKWEKFREKLEMFEFFGKIGMVLGKEILPGPILRGIWGKRSALDEYAN